MGKPSGQKTTVAGGAYREFLRVIAGHSGQLFKVGILNIQGQIHKVALDNLGIGGDIVGRVSGVLGVLFQPGLVVLEPVIAVTANGIQPEVVNGLFSAKTLLFTEYGGDCCITGYGKCAAIRQFGFFVAGFADDFYGFIAGIGFCLYDNFSILRSFYSRTGGQRVMIVTDF